MPKVKNGLKYNMKAIWLYQNKKSYSKSKIAFGILQLYYKNVILL